LTDSGLEKFLADYRRVNETNSVPAK